MQYTGIQWLCVPKPFYIIYVFTKKVCHCNHQKKKKLVLIICKNLTQMSVIIA